MTLDFENMGRIPPRNKKKERKKVKREKGKVKTKEGEQRDENRIK